MANQFAAPPINPIISVTPLVTPQAGRDASQVPQALANVPNGTTVEGFVVNRDGQNNPILRTPLGDILIKSDFFLKTGSTIVFRVDNTQASRARIITIDGLTPSEYAAENIRPAATDSVRQSLPSAATAYTDGETIAPLPSEQNTFSLPIKAVLLASTPATKAVPSPTTAITQDSAGSSASPRALEPLQAGTVLKLTVLKATLPAFTSPAPVVNAASIAAALVGDATVAHSTASTATTNPSPIHPTLTTNITPSPPTIAPALASGTPISAQSVLPAAVDTALTPVTHSPASFATPPLPSGAPVGTDSPPSSSAVVNAAPATPQPVLPVLQAATLLASLSPSPTIPDSAVPLPDTTAPAPHATPQNQQPAPSLVLQTLPATSAVSAYRSAGHLIAPLPSSSFPTPVSTIHNSASRETPSPQESPLIATVIGQEADGATILQTPIGTLKTHLPQPLPAGTELTISLAPESARATTDQAAITLSDTLDQAASFARDWKSLADAAQWLRTNDPQIWQQITQQWAQPNVKLTSDLLFFIAAIKGGDVAAFFGKRASQTLESKALDLLGKLRSDVSQLQQLAGESPGKSWSMLILPVMIEGHIEQARFFYRQESGEKEQQAGKKNGPQHRFILEVDLSHIGSLQMDGFVRSGHEKRIFDLILRSEKPLLDAITRDIRTIFDNALSATGYHGQLSFQQGSQHFVRPLAQVAADNAGPQPILA